MPRRHLFGPVSPAFTKQHLRRHIDAGACRVFDHDGPLAVGPLDAWDDVAARLPADWRPECLVLRLQDNMIPAALWRAPIPIVGLAGGHRLLWHHYRHVLPLCDWVLTDAPGVERLARDGITHAREARLLGCERAFAEFTYGDGPRDIDILFVGNFHPAVQGERLPWLGRVGKLAKRWNVHLTAGVVDDEYRKLLGRARIVFNRSVGGVWNQRASEAIGAGALLFQEAENLEVARLLRAGEEYVAYDEANLEERLEYYLEHEDERRRIAEKAHLRKQEFTHEAFWDDGLRTIDAAWPELQERAARRCERGATLSVSGRVWQQASCHRGADTTLVADLNEALAVHPRSPELKHALGVALVNRAPRDVRQIMLALQTAWQSDPRHIMAGLNLAEVLVSAGQHNDAGEQIRRTLAMLDATPKLPTHTLDAAHVPTGFDTFRVEWERAAWENAGDRSMEEKTKRRLLRWRLYALLESLTHDLGDALAAWSERPDLPESNGTLGKSLHLLQKPMEALSYVRRCRTANPFDAIVAKEQFDILLRLERTSDALQLADELQSLARAAPTLLHHEPWFAESSVQTARDAQPTRTTLRIVWHGAQATLHSLALVNRELCAQLLRNGHELALIEPDRRELDSSAAPLADELRARLGATLSGPADVHVGHQWPPEFTPPPDGHWVIMQPWEFGSIPQAWVAPLTQCVDEIWTPSRFTRYGFVNSGIPAERVHVIPNGVAPIFFEKHEAYPLQTGKRFKFLFVGGTIARKGIDLLLHAYQRCFSAADDVCLVIKDLGVGTFYQGQSAEQAIAEFRGQRHAPEIEYRTEEFSPADMARLYAACNCLVQPFRAEGFGLPIAEALAAGLPVIATGFGAAVDFCNADHAYLIDAHREDIRPLPGEAPTAGQEYWAAPNADHLRRLMRHVMDHPDEARAKARGGQEFIRRNYTWEHAVNALEARLAALRLRLPRRTQLQPPALHAPSPQRNGQPRVSVTMIVRNEEANLADCLRSIADLVHEIIIVDTGSTDRTKEIARQFGAKVFDFPWIDNFAAARNEALKHATGDWVLWLDADDRLDEDNRGKLHALFARLPQQQMVGFVIQCRCPFPDQDRVDIVKHVRLFPNRPTLRWKYRIHEQILPSLKDHGGVVEHSDVVIEHIGYKDAAIHRGKGQRNFRLLELAYQDDPDDPYVMFNLSSFLQEQRRFPEALAMMQRSLRLSKPADSIVPPLYYHIALTQRLQGDHAAAVQTCREGRQHCPHDVDILFEEGTNHRVLGDSAAAADCFALILENREGGHHFGNVNPAKRGYLARYMLGLCLKETGNAQESERQFRLILQERPTYAPALVELGALLIAQQRFAEAEPLLTHLETLPDSRLHSLVLRAQLHHVQSAFGEARALLEQAVQEFPREIFPRLNLARLLCNEGRDPTAAERVLREILVIDPNETEAKQRLEELLR